MLVYLSLEIYIMFLLIVKKKNNWSKMEEKSLLFISIQLP